MVSEKFVEAMINARKGKGITQEKIAELLNVSVVTVSGIEHHEVNMDMRQCLLISEKLDIPIMDVFEEATENIQKMQNVKKVNLLGSICLVLCILIMVVPLSCNWYAKCKTDNIITCTVLDKGDDFICVKELYSDDEVKIYNIKIDDRLSKNCDGIEVGDVVRINYFFELSDSKTNNSVKIASIVGGMSKLQIK